jgi:hypothetical protein
MYGVTEASDFVAMEQNDMQACMHALNPEIACTVVDRRSLLIENLTYTTVFYNTVIASLIS